MSRGRGQGSVYIVPSIEMGAIFFLEIKWTGLNHIEHYFRLFRFAPSKRMFKQQHQTALFIAPPRMKQIRPYFRVGDRGGGRALLMVCGSGGGFGDVQLIICIGTK